MLSSHETVSSNIMGKTKSPSPLMHTACSHFCHRAYIGPIRGQVSALAQGPPEMVRIDFTHPRWEKTKQGPLSLCASSIRLQTGCGRIEGVPWGTFLSAPLSPPSCPHPLCTRRNRQLRGPVKVRRSASYITSLLSWGWAAELTSALIIAVGLWRPSPRIPGGKPWARMRQWKGASGCDGGQCCDEWLFESGSSCRSWCSVQWAPCRVVVTFVFVLNFEIEYRWFWQSCGVAIYVCLASSSTRTQICREWCTNSTATWSSVWTLEETTNSCSMSCVTSSKQVKGVVAPTHWSSQRWIGFRSKFDMRTTNGEKMKMKISKKSSKISLKQE